MTIVTISFSWWRGHDRLGKACWLVRALPLAIGVSGFQILADSTAAEEDAVLALVGLAFTRLLIAAPGLDRYRAVELVAA